MITIHPDQRPLAAEIAPLYAVAPLRRPIHDLARLQQMFDGSNVVVCARQAPGGALVGIVRGWTDGVYDGYVCDLAVHPRVQRQGVGRKLLGAVVEAYPQVQWILLSSPLAQTYYPHLGWQAAPACWVRSRVGWNPGSYEEFAREHAELAKAAAHGGNESR